MSKLDILASIGEQIKRIRLRANVDQQSLADDANISLSALKNLERGSGATLQTFIAALRALGREEWLATLSPVVSVSPMAMISRKSERRRASRTSRARL